MDSECVAMMMLSEMTQKISMHMKNGRKQTVVKGQKKENQIAKTQSWWFIIATAATNNRPIEVLGHFLVSAV